MEKQGGLGKYITGLKKCLSWTVTHPFDPSTLEAEASQGYIDKKTPTKTGNINYVITLSSMKRSLMLYISYCHKARKSQIVQQVFQPEFILYFI